MTEQPTTAAGRALLDRLGNLPKLMPYDAEAVVAILAIEAEARQQDGSALRLLRKWREASLDGDANALGELTDETTEFIGDNAVALIEADRARLATLPPSVPPALDVERLEQAYFDGYKSGMANEVDDWNKPDEELRQFAAEYARLQEQER